MPRGVGTFNMPNFLDWGKASVHRWMHLGVMDSYVKKHRLLMIHSKVFWLKIWLKMATIIRWVKKKMSAVPTSSLGWANGWNFRQTISVSSHTGSLNFTREIICSIFFLKGAEWKTFICQSDPYIQNNVPKCSQLWCIVITGWVPQNCYWCDSSLLLSRVPHLSGFIDPSYHISWCISFMQDCAVYR